MVPMRCKVGTCVTRYICKCSETCALETHKMDSKLMIYSIHTFSTVKHLYQQVLPSAFAVILGNISCNTTINVSNKINETSSFRGCVIRYRGGTQLYYFYIITNHSIVSQLHISMKIIIYQRSMWNVVLFTVS